MPEELARRREQIVRARHPLDPLRRLPTRGRRPIVAAFDAIEHPHLWRVRPADLLCEDFEPGRCAQSLGDRPLYFDESHLNNAGARLVAPAIVATVEAARRDVGRNRQAARPTTDARFD